MLSIKTPVLRFICSVPGGSRYFSNEDEEKEECYCASIFIGTIFPALSGRMS